MLQLDFLHRLRNGLGEPSVSNTSKPDPLKGDGQDLLSAQLQVKHTGVVALLREMRPTALVPACSSKFM